MDEQKRPDEEYSFMQEVIKDEAGSKKVKHDIWRMIGLGIVLGLTASITFCALHPVVEDRFQGDPQEVTIPQDEEEEEPQEPEVVEQEDTYPQMIQEFGTIANGASGSVVTVLATDGTEDVLEQAYDQSQMTTGIILADNGRELLVVGKSALIENAKNLAVVLADRTSYEATVKSQDENLGFAVYAIPRDQISEDTWKEIHTATLGSSHTVNPGDAAIVIGSTVADAPVVSYGIISARESYEKAADGFYDLISVDMASAGIESGIILNERGEVVGILSAPSSQQEESNYTWGFAISDLKAGLEMLSNGEGVPYIGIGGEEVTEEMTSEGIPIGVYVKEVAVDSPAMAAGIQSGDVIVGIGDSEVATMNAYHTLLMKEKKDAQIEVQGKRQGSGGEYVDITFKVTVGNKTS